MVEQFFQRQLVQETFNRLNRQKQDWLEEQSRSALSKYDWIGLVRIIKCIKLRCHPQLCLKY